MSVKSDKNQKFLDLVYSDISSVVSAYEEGLLTNYYELKKALYESVAIQVKQSFINGIEVGKRKKQK